MIPVLIWIADHNRFYNFVEAEFASLNDGHARLTRKTAKGIFVDYHGTYSELKTWAAKLHDQSMFMKHVIQVVAVGKTLSSCLDSVTEDTKDNVHAMLGPRQTLSWIVETGGSSICFEEKIELIEQACRIFKEPCKVDLKTPEVQFALLQEFSEDGQVYCAIGAITASVGKGERAHAPYKLSKRPILGTTTLDVELAFLMNTFANVGLGSLVYDPFAGTGGTLIPSSHLGAVPLASDLDPRVLCGYAVSYVNKVYDGLDFPSCRMETNFKHYGLRTPDLFLTHVSDVNIRDGTIDAIVCDPPYGIRATARNGAEALVGDRLHGLFYELIDLAVRLLRPSGRLVFLIPVTSDYQVTHEYIESLIGGKLKFVFPPVYEQLNSGLNRYCVALERLPARNGFDSVDRHPF